MNATEMTEFAHASRAAGYRDFVAPLNDLQSDHVISDLVIIPEDIASADVPAALHYLRQKASRRTASQVELL